jgi:pyruvate dehydrogenase E2 component (dihydrolipoamide acetyltransferase)
LSDVAKALAARFTLAKQHVPHYYLSTDLDLSKLISLRKSLNASLKEGEISVMDFMVKASSLAMKQVRTPLLLLMTSIGVNIHRYGHCFFCIHPW